MKKNKSAQNITASLVLQFVTIISGFIIPKIIMTNFGSEVNGLVSSATQFLNYINLIEGGISSVVMASLYKPLQEGDNEKVSSIVATTNRFFKKLGIVFVTYSIVLSLIFPFLVKSSFSYAYVSTIILILSISLFIQYFFSLTWKLLLQADQKVYISSYVQVTIIILTTVLTVISVKLFPSVHLVKIIAALAFIIQPILFNRYVRKNYDLDKDAPVDNSVLSQRWNAFGINLAAFFTANTDITALTIFSNLSNVSIYAVYSLVTTGLKSIVTAISGGIVPTLGNAYAQENEERLNTVFDTYESLVSIITYTAFTIAIVVIVPFVLVYTRGITDANYEQPVFGVLFLISTALFCIREPFVNMCYIAGHFKEASRFAYIEVIINVTLSSIFVYKFGLNGAAIGSLFSMSFRTVCHVVYLRKHIMHRSLKKFLKTNIVHTVASLLGIFICTLLFDITATSFISWIILTVKVGIVIVLLQALFSFVFLRKSLMNVIRIRKI